MSDRWTAARRSRCCWRRRCSEIRISCCWTNRPTIWISSPSAGWKTSCWISRIRSSSSAHDRHFLNKVCTHICDIDFGKIQMYVGNYDFWYEYTQMVARQQKDIEQEERAEDQGIADVYSALLCQRQQVTSRRPAARSCWITSQMENYYAFLPPLSVYRVEAGSRDRQRFADRDQPLQDRQRRARCSTTSPLC